MNRRERLRGLRDRDGNLRDLLHVLGISFRRDGVSFVFIDEGEILSAFANSILLADGMSSNAKKYEKRLSDGYKNAFGEDWQSIYETSKGISMSLLDYRGHPSLRGFYKKALTFINNNNSDDIFISVSVTEYE